MAGFDDSTRWRLLPSDSAAEARLVEEFSVSPLVARVMVARGLTDVDRVRTFLNPDLATQWHEPSVIPGLTAVADRLEKALDAGETIAVFGDFDVDGMTSTTLLTRGLRALGADVCPFIPSRFDEGYGLSSTAMERLIGSCHPDLVVTVDNGIAGAREVEQVLAQGIDVAITDHHEPADLVPTGVPVADPKLEPENPSRDLAGVGVALKLVQELGRRRGQPDLWLRYLDLASLGTISDMMNLMGENRALVDEGIRQMRLGSWPGFTALAAVARCDLATIESDGLPFSLIPRLNAAGRMGDVSVALDLLLSDDPGEAAQLAARLETVNGERRAAEQALDEAAQAQAHQVYHGEKCLVLAGEGWHEGVKGIVAARFVNRYGVPCILFSIGEDGLAHGSGRSVGSINLFQAVERCDDLLVRFGGHAGAVGVTIKKEDIPEFKARLDQVLSELPETDFTSTGEVAAEVGLGELDLERVGSLDVLRPFGQANKVPLFVTRAVRIQNAARVGAKGEHLRFQCGDGIHSVPAIMFRAPDPDGLMDHRGLVDVVFEAVVETWQGRSKVKMMVKDILPRPWSQAMPTTTDAAAEPPLLGEDPDPADDAPALNPGARKKLLGLKGDKLVDSLRQRMIGDHPLLPCQKAAIEALGEGESVLAVMATGRGKSLIFHIHAAVMALAQRKASVFVYPLRALVADQVFHLEKALAPLGIQVRTLTGETPQAERERVYGELERGEAHVILTTPEYLAIHKDEIGASGPVGFLAIDEAHHAGASKSGHRSAYQDLPAIREALGQPVVLACSATCTDSAAREVMELCAIDADHVLVDATVRSNLSVDDGRDIRDRDLALTCLVSQGEKTIVYVNSRMGAQALVRMLRHAIPELARRIAFYHAGLPRATRNDVEDAFRDGTLTCIVSTSAFGEGVNLPDVRHVVLYHMPFGSVEFNQMSGRAGRDGAPAQVHPLFGPADATLDERILDCAAPTRDELVAIYRTLRTLGRQRQGVIDLDDGSIAASVAALDPAHPVGAPWVASALSIFEELGFLTLDHSRDGRTITMVENPGQADLEDSIRYGEGMRAREQFETFRDWVVATTPEALQEHIDRPIAPSFGQVVDGA